jgi:vacuolar-type H+-ATPase subunit E/Vma4
LIKDLIIQGMTQMIENECIVRVRKEDYDAISAILSKCEKEYHEIMKKETGRDYNCKLSLDSKFLEVP